MISRVSGEGRSDTSLSRMILIFHESLAEVHTAIFILHCRGYARFVEKARRVAVMQSIGQKTKITYVT